MEVADRVVLMNDGRVEQVGTPEEVFERPATPFVMGFLGSTNVFHGRVEAGRARLGPLDVEFDGGGPGRSASGFVRPHEMDVAREPEGSGALPATLLRVHGVGALVKLELASEAGSVLEAELTRERYETLRPMVGETLFVRPLRVRIFTDPAGPGA